MYSKFTQKLDKAFHLNSNEDMSELEETKSFDNIDEDGAGDNFETPEGKTDDSAEVVLEDFTEAENANVITNEDNSDLSDSSFDTVEFISPEKLVLQDENGATEENAASEESAAAEENVTPEESAATEEYQSMMNDVMNRIDILNNVVTNDTFMQTITELSDKIDSISKCYEEKIKYDEGKQTTINRQYSELQSIREGIPYSYLKSIIKDIILTMTDLRRMTRSFKNKLEKGEELSIDHVIDTYASYEDDLLDILEKNGVDTYSYESNTYEPRKQKAVKIIDTSDESLNKVVAERLMDGFIKTEYRQVEDSDTKELKVVSVENIIEKEHVNVYKYVPAETEKVNESEE
jgi:molecular chaperone GrpE (heat shock protein)